MALPFECFKKQIYNNRSRSRDSNLSLYHENRFPIDSLDQIDANEFTKCNFENKPSNIRTNTSFRTVTFCK